MFKSRFEERCVCTFVHHNLKLYTPNHQCFYDIHKYIFILYLFSVYYINIDSNLI